MANVFGYFPQGETNMADGNYVTLDTNQTITAAKTFSSATTILGALFTNGISASNIFYSNSLDPTLRQIYTTFYNFLENTSSAPGNYAGRMYADTNNLYLELAAGKSFRNVTGGVQVFRFSDTGTSFGLANTSNTIYGNTTIINNLQSNQVMPATSDSSTIVPTTSWVQSAITSKINSAPYVTLDTNQTITGYKTFYFIKCLTYIRAEYPIDSTEDSDIVATTAWVNTKLAPIYESGFFRYEALNNNAYTTYTNVYPPTGAKIATISLVGGGGGSGASNNGGCINAAGGGSGSSCTFKVYFDPTLTSYMTNYYFNLTIGGGGTGGALPNGSGSNGLNTTVEVHFTYSGRNFAYNVVAYGGGGATSGIYGIGGATPTTHGYGNDPNAQGAALYAIQNGSDGSLSNDNYGPLSGVHYPLFPFGSGGIGNAANVAGSNGGMGIVYISYSY